MSDAKMLSAADAFDEWCDSVLSGEGPTLYALGDEAFEGIEIGPGRVALLGGAPGTGKTALAMQWTLDALETMPDLRALVCNVEMSVDALLDRQLARLSGIELTLIRHRRLSAGHGAAVERGLATLERLGERLAFVRPPYNLENVAQCADAFDAGLIVLDYIQRVGAPGTHSDRRGAVDASMSYLRQFADAGVAVLVVAALARGKDRAGRSTYDGDAVSLASFRETSELEYGCDDGFILTCDGEREVGVPPSRVLLRHLKSRHGETRDIALDFDRPRQRFTAAETCGGFVQGGRLRAALRDAWDRTRSTDGGHDE
jgi:replicative DNA helicase